MDQSFNDFEFLIYDDGSDEECRRFIEEIGQLDSRIRILRGEENRGIAYGLNACIRAAKGAYLARMDGDDISLPHRLEVQKAFLDVNPEFDYVGSAAALLEGEKLWGMRRLADIPQKEDFLSFSPYIHPSVMFRREIFEKYGLYNTQICAGGVKTMNFLSAFTGRAAMAVIWRRSSSITGRRKTAIKRGPFRAAEEKQGCAGRIFRLWGSADFGPNCINISPMERLSYLRGYIEK